MSDKWKEETILALQNLGGIAHLDEIFEQIVKQNNIDMSKSKTPKRTLSKTLQTYSLSTDYGKANIFYSVYGVKARKGVWGLIDKTFDNIKINLTQDDIFFPEGEKILRKHIIRERNSALIKRAKALFKQKHNDRLYCEVCGFDFYQMYGKIGENFIEAHHTIPICEMDDEKKTDINDIVMLCSNCHSMIHRKRPWLKKHELKKLIYKNQ